MKKLSLLLLGIALFGAGLHAQPGIVAKFVVRSHTYQGTTLPYRLFIPDFYSRQNTYPLVLALHGSGERGTDNIIQVERNALATSWADPVNQVRYPCFVAVPQCPPGQDWTVPAMMNTVNNLLDSLTREFTVDTNRLYITGLSMGGYGTWAMISAFPDRFAAAVPMSGGWYPTVAPLIQHVPIWNFHGSADELVPVEQSREMIAALEDIGRQAVYTHCRYNFCSGLPDSTITMCVNSHADLFYTEYEGGAHDIWVGAYYYPHLFPWVFDKYKLRMGAITLTSLKSYQSLSGTQVITWQATDPRDSVEIWFSPDAGGRWVLVTGSAPNNGSYSWNTEQRADCAFGTIKIFLKNSGGHIYSFDQSRFFSINNTMNGVPFARILNREFYLPTPINLDSLRLSLLVGDAETKPLTVRISYSPDGGTVFTPVQDYVAVRDTAASLHTIYLPGLPNSDLAVIKVAVSDGADSSSVRTVPFVKRTPRLSGPGADHVSGSGSGTLTVHVVDAAQLTGHLYRLTIDDTLYDQKVYDVLDVSLGSKVVRNATELDGKTEGPIFDGLRLLLKDSPQPEPDPVNTRWRVGAPTLLDVGPYLPTLFVGGQDVKGIPYPADYTITFSDHVVDTSSGVFSEFPAIPVQFTVWNQTENRKAVFGFIDNDGNHAVSNFDEIFILERDTLGVLRLSWGLTYAGGPQSTLPRPGDEFVFVTLKPLSHRDVYEFRGLAVSVSALARPQHVTLEQNYPNPFNPTTTIEYNIGGVVALSGAHFSGVEGRAYTNVRLVVYDILGREVATLMNEMKQPGTYTVHFDARLPGGQGSNLASGVYFYRLQAGDFVVTKRLLLLK